MYSGSSKHSHTGWEISLSLQTEKDTFMENVSGKKIVKYKTIENTMAVYIVRALIL